MKMMYHTLTSDSVFKNSSFPSAVTEWNKLDSKLHKFESFTKFKKKILSFIRPRANSVFNCNSSKGLKFVTRLCPGLCHSNSNTNSNIISKIL